MADLAGEDETKKGSHLRNSDKPDEGTKSKHKTNAGQSGGKKEENKMGIASDMKNLGEDIIASHDMRVRELGGLFSNVHQTLDHFAADRIKMKEDQEKMLSNFTSNLSKDVQMMRKDILQAHKEMADQLRASLDLVRPGLDKSDADRLKDFRVMMGDINKSVQDIEKFIASKLKEFHSTHANMSKELRKDLSKYAADIAGETSMLLKGFDDENKQMSESWKAMSAIMAKKRGMQPMTAAEPKMKAMTEEKPSKSAKAKPMKKAMKKKKNK